jgi:hypothetical protein
MDLPQIYFEPMSSALFAAYFLLLIFLPTNFCGLLFFVGLWFAIVSNLRDGFPARQPKLSFFKQLGINPKADLSIAGRHQLCIDPGALVFTIGDLKVSPSECLLLSRPLRAQ